MNEMSRFVIQRASAALLAPLVLAHLVLIVVASNQGLSAAEILERTRGSLGWAAFYGVFVIAAAAHGATGLQVVLREWTALADKRAGQLAWAAFALLLVLGLRAVYAVINPAGVS